MQDQQPIVNTPKKDAICQQPQCALRKEGVGADQLADAILDILTGKEASPILDSGAITRRDLCRECVQSIFDGQSLPLTTAEAEQRAKRTEERLRRRFQRTQRRM